MAVSWGTPTPATILVVQIDPGPTPTLTASAPASIRAFVPSAVATLPAMTWRSGNLDFILSKVSITFLECPWAVSMTIRSTPASTRAATLSKASSPVPTAAPTLSLPISSLQAFGYCILFTMSFIVISPFILPSLSTIGSFSILYFWNIAVASSRVMPSSAVIRLSLVMNRETGLS